MKPGDLRRIRVTAVVFPVAAMMLPLVCSAAEPANYGELTKLFTEWRGFTRPAIANGLQDYSAAAMRPGYDERPARGQKRILHDRRGSHPLVCLDGRSRLVISQPASRSHARGINAAAQQAGRPHERLVIEQGAFERKRWRLFALSLGQHRAALEQHKPGGGLEEVGAELDVGLARLLKIGEVLAGDLGDGQLAERVLVTAD